MKLDSPVISEQLGTGSTDPMPIVEDSGRVLGMLADHILNIGLKPVAAPQPRPATAAEPSIRSLPGSQRPRQ